MSSAARRLGGRPVAMTAGRVVVPMRGLGVAVGADEGLAVCNGDGGGVETAVAVAAVASAVGPCAIALGAVPCPWRSSTLPRGAAAGSTTRTANAAAAPIRT